jgi:hypothetical protein
LARALSEPCAEDIAVYKHNTVNSEEAIIMMKNHWKMDARVKE